MSQLTEYNTFIFNNEIISSFMPCHKSSIFKPIDIIFEKNNTTTGHVMLDTFRRKRGSYFSCITYCNSYLKSLKKNVDKKQQQLQQQQLVEHVCDIFPVAIGSTLDIDICRLINPTIFPANCPAFTQLSGMIFVDGSLSFMPYLLTNRKELGHKVKHGNELFCLYVYDIENRGHKLSIDGDNKITYRNQNGEEDITISNTTRFTVDTRHLNNAKIKLAFQKLYSHPVDIDGLENKLTLSPVNILHLLILMALKNPKDARDYIIHGELEKFASSKIIYKTQNYKNQKYSSGFNYRKLQPNQIIKNVGEETHQMERMIVRPIPKNVPKTSIPKNTEYYFCLVEKSLSAESPNRWLMMLPNVIVSDKTTMTYLLNNLLDDLLASKLIKWTTSIKRERIILVDGGLLTNYSINCTDDELLFFVKEKNQLIEIYSTCDFVMFNLTTGLPFVSILYKDINVMVSPLELNTYFLHLKETIDGQLFGSSIDSDTIKLAGYNDPHKFISGVNYNRNRYSSDMGAQYFPYTTENVSCYIKNMNSINVKTIFSAHPQVTADSYTMNKELKFPSIIYQRSRFDIDIQSGVNIFFNKDLSPENFLYDVDSMGNKTCKYICIAEIQKLNDDLKYKIYPQTKLYLQKRKTANGYVYHLFRMFDDQHQLLNNFNISVSAIFDNDVKKKKLYIDIMTSTDVNFYDGFKLSDTCSQKGLVCQQDISRHEMKPDLVASVYSIIGRSPLAQLKLLKINEINYPKDEKILFGNYTFSILKNLSFPIKSNTRIKFDLYSKKVLSTNNLLYTIHEKEQESLQPHDRNTFLPAENAQTVGILNNLKIGFHYTDEHGNSFKQFNLINREEMNHELAILKNLKKKKTKESLSNDEKRRKLKEANQQLISDDIDMMKKDSAIRKTRKRNRTNAFLLDSPPVLSSTVKNKKRKISSKFKEIDYEFNVPLSPVSSTIQNDYEPTSPKYIPSFDEEEEGDDDDDEM